MAVAYDLHSKRMMDSICRTGPLKFGVLISADVARALAVHSARNEVKIVRNFIFFFRLQLSRFYLAVNCIH